MRCKKHISDTSSSVGVCASCLRERLFSLIAAQAQAQAHSQAQAQAQARAAEECRKSDPHPPPPGFPRSVSPYISRRKSDDASWQHHLRHHHSLSDQRFYSTPQVGPTYKSATVASAITSFSKKKQGKFSLFASIFRSRSEKSESQPRVSADSGATSSSAQNWLSSVLSGRRKKQSRLFTLEDSPAGGRLSCRARDRGMSPDDTEPCEDYEASPSVSGYSSEVWRTPVTGPAGARRGRSSCSRNVSGLAFCLSPLVRASPSRHWNQKGMPPEVGFSGEVRISNKPHLSAAASFCANRSRKLADFGRFNHNH